MSRFLTRRKVAAPAPEVVHAGLRSARFARLRLDQIARGLDERHIDVAFDPTSEKVMAGFVRSLVRAQLRRVCDQTDNVVDHGSAADFASVVGRLHEVAIRKAVQLRRVGHVQLFQLAVLRMLFGQIDAELARLRRELEDARSQPVRQLSGPGLLVHQQSVVFSRNAAHIRYQVAAQVVRELMRLDLAGLRRRRKAVLGTSWPIAQVILGNPLLQLDGLGRVRDFCRIYPLLLHDRQRLARASQALLEVFADWIPADDVPLQGEAARRPRTGKAPSVGSGMLNIEPHLRPLFSQQALDAIRADWLDCPENASALLGGSKADWPDAGPWRHPGVARLQGELSDRWAVRLEQAGLMTAVVASYELMAIYPSLGLTDAEHVVFDWLRGVSSRRDTIRRLAAIDGVTDAAGQLRRIEDLRRDFRDRPANGRRQLLARFAADVLRLRRDLKLAWLAFDAMGVIRLVSDPQEQALAQADKRLQFFRRDGLQQGQVERAHGHVILKAEIRGASELAAAMRQRGLNAAVHFSRYLYDPVERLQHQFDAQQVAVEGDALMLLLLAYDGESEARPAVACACCLAACLIDLVDALNAAGDRHGLPHLEFGLGIAYAAEPPSYLFDRYRKITLSPAISRARQLASCHAVLRDASPLPGRRGLFVVSPVHAENGDATRVDHLVRYNVDGIELDAAAFSQLHFEIPLHRLRLRTKSGRAEAVLFAGKCLDREGEEHWLVVREQRVKLWMGRQIMEREDEGRCVHEVVTDARLRARARSRVEATADPPGAASTAPKARH